MSEQNSFLGDILIIIVLYKQSLVNCESFKSLYKATGTSSGLTLLVYDNSPKAGHIPDLNSWVVHHHHDPSNPGVSKAYNEGFKIATHLKKTWLLLADQDTTFPSTLFSDFWRAVQDHPQNTVFVPSLYDSAGLLSPFRLIWGRGTRVGKFQLPVQSFRDFKTINSGMLLSLTAFERAAGYDERFRLDYSDISFCDRLARNDPDFVLIPTSCHHNFSGSDNSSGDLQIEFDRFTLFCRTVQLYKKITPQFVSLSWTILPRALKLSIEWRTFRFLIVGAKYALRNR